MFSFVASRISDILSTPTSNKVTSPPSLLSVPLQALGIRLGKVRCCDVKAISKTFVTNNFGPEVCWYDSQERLLKSAADGCQCDNPHHADGASSACQQQHDPDVLIMGLPCQPFSVCRDHKAKMTKKTDSVTSHELYEVTMTDAIHHIDRLRPGGVIVEQVVAFNSPIRPGYDQTFMDLFVEKVRAIRDKCGKILYTGIKIVALNPTCWLDVNRNRFSAFTCLCLV